MNNETGDIAAPAPEPETPSPTPTSTLATKSQPADHISSLHSSLYQLILLNSSAIYYLDCFSLLLGLRYICLVQASHGGGSGIRSLTTCLLICLAVHTFNNLPQPTSYAPHLLHGGALVDFVGERPAGRLRLVTLDLWLFALQIMYLALGRKLTKLKQEPADAAGEAGEVQTQDVEAEEAGISRAEEAREQRQSEADGGIEMQSLMPQDVDDDQLQQSRDEKGSDSVVVLRKSDLFAVFSGDGTDSQSSEMNAATRRFWARVRLLQELQARQVERATATDAARPV